MGNRHVVRRVTAVAATLAVAVLTGCSGAASNDDVEQACEGVAGKAVVSWWEEQGRDTPWDVTDATGTNIKKGSESSDEATVFYVDGDAAVRQDEGGTKVTVHWSCFAQYTSNDPNTVYASIREVTAA